MVTPSIARCTKCFSTYGMPRPRYWKARPWRISRTPVHDKNQKVGTKRRRTRASSRWLCMAMFRGVRGDTKGLLLRRGCRGFPAGLWPARDLAECFVRPDTRAVSGLQRGICEVLEGEDGARRHHPAVTWRIEQAGAGSH